jgi:hypothetical protein
MPTNYLALAILSQVCIPLNLLSYLDLLKVIENPKTMMNPVLEKGLVLDLNSDIIILIQKL